MDAGSHTFWLASPCLEQPSALPTLPTLVYAILVPKEIGSWWVVKLNMRLEGDLKDYGRWHLYVITFLPNVRSDP